MCLILFALDATPDFPLILAANRDEFHSRPTEPLHRWPDGIIAGRDQRAGGTWLGVAPGRGWAALTNYRDAQLPADFPRSRGLLIPDYLRSDLPPDRFLEAIDPALYDGFNLLAGNGDASWWTSNRAEPTDRLPLEIQSGIHGLSNHLLDTPWHKVVRGREALAGILADGPPSSENLLDILLDRVQAADDGTPSTGLSRQFERELSPIFIRTPEYGTRCSTALLIRPDGSGTIAERRFDPRGAVAGEITIDF